MSGPATLSCLPVAYPGAVRGAGDGARDRAGARVLTATPSCVGLTIEHRDPDIGEDPGEGSRFQPIAVPRADAKGRLARAHRLVLGGTGPAVDGNHPRQLAV